MVLAKFQPKALDVNQWKLVLIVAGIGTILEYFDFYCYTQLSAVLGKVFFPSGDPVVTALSYWGVFAIAFVSRPVGALFYGHIGDKYGRRWSFTFAILQQAFGTFLIGILPTYAIGRYSAGIASPILLAIIRIIQGTAFGGEFGGAAVYISELADVKTRARSVTALQCMVNIGLALASLLSLALQASLSKEAMLEWGWRVPFLVAGFTAFIGYYIRRGLPEPAAFVNAKKEEQLADEAEGVEGGATVKADAGLVVGTPTTGKATPESDDEESDVDAQDQGVLTAFHGHSRAKLPFVRLLKNNATGLAIHFLFGAWVFGAFFVAVTWLATELANGFGLPGPIALTITIISLFFNAAGLLTAGYLLDHGLPAIRAWAATVVVGVSTGFGLYWWVGTGSIAALWVAPSLLHLVIGFGQAFVVLPLTRIYHPLERTTGFSFAFAVGYGILGGISPIVVTALKAKLPADIKGIAPALWLSILSAGSFIGVILLRLYLPRLDKPYVGRIR